MNEISTRHCNIYFHDKKENSWSELTGMFNWRRWGYVASIIRYADSLHQKPLAPSTNLVKNWKVTWQDPKQDIVDCLVYHEKKMKIRWGPDGSMS